MKRNRPLISINNCIFEISENSTSSTFIYMNGNKTEVLAEIKNCIFKGDWLNRIHHINDSSFNKISKLHIESCRFVSIRDSFDKLIFRNITLLFLSCVIFIISIFFVIQKTKC